MSKFSRQDAGKFRFLLLAFLLFRSAARYGRPALLLELINPGLQDLNLMLKLFYLHAVIDIDV
jgi:hypothetical protein